MFNCRNPSHHAWLVGFRFNISATIPSGSVSLRRMNSTLNILGVTKGLKSFLSPPKTSATETGQMSSAETGQMSAVETGQMSAAATRQMSSAKTRQISSGKTERCPVLPFYICLVSAEDICPVSAADICPVSTADICPVSTEDICPVSVADVLGGDKNDFSPFLHLKCSKWNSSGGARRSPAEPDGTVAETLKWNPTNHA